VVTLNKALINAGRERLFIELKDVQADGMLIPEVIGGTIGTLKNASAVIGPDCRDRIERLVVKSRTLYY
jgi:hypothetical protein